MRWPTTKPREGDIREASRFALLPTDIGGVTVWLERYGVVQRYETWFEGRGWADVKRFNLDAAIDAARSGGKGDGE